MSYLAFAVWWFIAIALGVSLGMVAYRLSPVGKRNRAEIKRLREEIKQREHELKQRKDEMLQATKRIENAIEIVKAKRDENIQAH